MNFETTNYNEFYAELKAALKDLEDKHGIDFNVSGNFRYDRDNTECSFKMNMVNRKADGSSAVEDLQLNKRLANWANAFHRYAYRFDLEGNLNAEITMQGAKYKVVGLRPKAKTNNIVVEVVAEPGKYVYAPTVWVQDALGIERTPVDGF